MLEVKMRFRSRKIPAQPAVHHELLGWRAWASGCGGDPILLCGAMFGLRLYEHRLFESSVMIQALSILATSQGPPRWAGRREMTSSCR